MSIYDSGERSSPLWRQFIAQCKGVAEGALVPREWKTVSASQNFRTVYRIDSTPERQYVSLWDNNKAQDEGEKAYYSLAVVEARYEAETLARQLGQQKRHQEIQNLHLEIPSLHSDRAVFIMPDFGSSMTDLIIQWYKNSMQSLDNPMPPRKFSLHADSLYKLPLFHPDFNLHGVLSKAIKGRRMYTSVDNTLIYAMGICFEADHDLANDVAIQLFIKMQKMFARRSDLGVLFLLDELSKSRRINKHLLEQAMRVNLEISATELLINYDDLPKVLKRNVTRAQWDQGLENQINIGIPFILNG